ncbi:hypothetical protein WME94_50870 [Sorangium sp. So ce429]
MMLLITVMMSAGPGCGAASPEPDDEQNNTLKEALVTAPPRTKLFASDGAAIDDFGRSVAFSTDHMTAIVGAPEEDDPTGTVTANNGAAYVFTRSGTTWTQQAKLLASDKASNDFFGFSVALSSDGNTAIVGAYREVDGVTTDNGAAYVFTRSGTTWTQQRKLLASDKATGDGFGFSVALSSDGNTAIVGSLGDKVYVFTRSGTTWTEQQKIVGNDTSIPDDFGISVALSPDGNTAIVGASEEDDGGSIGNGAAYVFTRSGAAWTQQAKLLASDKWSYDSFGGSVALSSDGNTAIVGAVGEGDPVLSKDSSGAAYVFTRSGTTWAQQAKLMALDGESFDYFGGSVALSSDGNTALIGAVGDDTSPTYGNGAAYVFARSGTTWAQQQKLVAYDRTDHDEFGRSVALSANGNAAFVGAGDADVGTQIAAGVAYMFTDVKLLADDKASDDHFGNSVALSENGLAMIVGAPGEDHGGTTDNGAAYVFTRSSTTAPWSQQQKLLASDKSSEDAFGTSVALSADGSTMIVGAPSEDDGSTSNNGAAYVFTKSGTTWIQQAKLLASDKANSDRFGWSVALAGNGNTAFVGAYQEDDPTGTATTNNGAAYVFTRSGTTWTQGQKLLAIDKASNDYFAFSIALSVDGNTAIVGARESDTGPIVDHGSAYVFTRSGATWTQEAKLLASDKAADDYFGFSVALSSDGSTAIVGAYLEDDSSGTATINNGAAYVYTRSGTAWAQRVKLKAPDKASDDNFGKSVALSSNGNVAIVGSVSAGYGSLVSSGTAYVFAHAGPLWLPVAKLLPFGYMNNFDSFGHSVALSGDGSTAIVGVHRDDDATGTATFDNGAVYAFTLPF